jgi:hypothetical protein
MKKTTETPVARPSRERELDTYAVKDAIGQLRELRTRLDSAETVVCA